MNIKNFLKPSDYAMLVPNGLPVTIQYGDQGIVQKYYLDWERSRLANPEVSTALTNLGAMRVFPTDISIKGGTSWVYGILVTDQICKSEGTLPQCTYNELIDKLLAKDYTGWKFFAGNILSLATKFGGAHPTLNWLKMNKFTVLPSKLIPVNPSKSTFESNWGDGYTLDEACSLFIYSGSNFEVKHLDKLQFIVNDMNMLVDPYGVIKFELKSADGQFTRYVNYADVVKYQVTKNSVVTFDGTELVSAIRLDKHKRKIYSLEASCPVCGRKLLAKVGQELNCADPHCKSKWFAQISQMLKVFNLPELSYDRFIAVRDKLVAISDIFSLEEYHSCKVECSLGKLLEAAVPQSCVRNCQVLHEFANKCDNDIGQFKYYIEHPDQINTDFKFVSNFSTEFISWLSDSYNCMDIVSLLNDDHIKIINSDRSFDGAPIFRGKVIALTGKFRRGDYNRIANILQSYSAKVVYHMTSDVNGLLVGDILEGINGSMVSECRNNGIPVMNESEFFSQYEIDKDMAIHLV